MADLAETHQPPLNYIENHGYANAENPAPQTGSISMTEVEEFNDDNDEDDYLYDSDLSDISPDSLSASNPGDFTKSYNRQKRLHDPDINPTQKPKTNSQKPTANTHSSVDDQIRDLTRHAGKIKLDERDSGLGNTNGKDKSDRATAEQVLDPRTRMLLLKMINRGVVSEIHGCISTGKEANVYHALHDHSLTQSQDAVSLQNSGLLSQHRAIKVYKTSILVFKDRDKYVTGEYRFRAGYNKASNRSMVKIWAEKEMRNLKRIFNAGIPCPEPHYLRAHVLVMGFLGTKKGWPAPRLRDVKFGNLDTEQEEKKWTGLYRQLLAYVRILYAVCRLVHADLSEYNLLFHEDKLWIIDVSQSVEHDHPRSLEFLRIDIRNISLFFANKGVDVFPEQTVFDFVTAIETPTEFNDIIVTLGRLQDLRQESESNEKRTTTEELMEREIDQNVFRQQYIPQTLDQVYDIERDAEKIYQGEVKSLVYRSLLASQTRKSTVETNHAGPYDATSNKAEDEKDESGSDDSTDGNSEGEWIDKSQTPRGKKHIDKSSKKEHKTAVKEEKREKRKTKMKKHVKKRLVEQSSRHKK